jgi:AraC-like DNA-binding protein
MRIIQFAVILLFSARRDSMVIPLSIMFTRCVDDSNKCILRHVSIDHTKAVYLIKLLEVLREHSCPVTPVLTACGISEASLQDHDASIPISQYLMGVETAVAMNDIADLGFLVGEQTTALEHGVLGYALLSSPTLRDCLQRYVKFQYLQGPLLTISFVESESTSEMQAIPRRGSWPISPAAYRYIVQEWLVGWNQWCQLIGRSGSFFEHVRLGYSSDGQHRHYEEHLGCTVSFNNDNTTAVFASRRLDLPLSYADKSIVALCDVQCERLLEILKLRAGLVADIHRQLANRPGQVPNMDEMARNLNIGTRTLRRRLKEENTTYQQVVSEFRLAMAKRYLGETSLPANEVAMLVGYSDSGNLYRTFQRETGQTPSQYRDKLKA